MDDYRKKAQQKYLNQQKIIIEENAQVSEKQLAEEKLAKEAENKLMYEKQEHLEKIRVEQTKKQVYIQSQMLIIDESIDSFKTDKTDDNIMLILTIISASIENILKMIGNDEKKILLEQILKFTTEVDKNNTIRPKGVNTIANVKILKDGFTQIYDMLNLNIDIQTLDTENDEKIANELEKELNNLKHRKLKHDFDDDGYIVDNDFINDINDVNDHEHIAPLPHPQYESESDNDDVDVENDDNYDSDEDDETIAKKMQDKWNTPKKKVQLKPAKAILRDAKYAGLNCEEFMKMLLGEKVYV